MCPWVRHNGTPRTVKPPAWQVDRDANTGLTWPTAQKNIPPGMSVCSTLNNGGIALKVKAISSLDMMLGSGLDHQFTTSSHARSCPDRIMSSDRFCAPTNAWTLSRFRHQTTASFPVVGFCMYIHRTAVCSQLKAVALRGSARLLPFTSRLPSAQQTTQRDHRVEVGHLFLFNRPSDTPPTRRWSQLCDPTGYRWTGPPVGATSDVGLNSACQPSNITRISLRSTTNPGLGLGQRTSY
jgi:hypothetical protein